MKASIIAALFGIAILAGVGYAAWRGLDLVYQVFASLSPEMAALTAIACILALTAAWTIARGGIGLSRDRVKEVALREEKTTTYQLFLDFWQGLLHRGRTPAGDLPVDLSGKLHLLERLLALYGAATVMCAHSELRALEAQKGARHPEVRARLAQALLAVRRDLGADTPLNAAYEIDRLLLPTQDAAPPASADARDARFRTVLATGE
jgi:hypothetical protein